MFSQQDEFFMARAIELAKQGQFTTTPNPNVGCVVVKGGEIIAEGWHQKAGTGHAEVNAFVQLSDEQAIGATAYVTLEPCSHYGRTPPCAELLINARVGKVVVAMLDPNPKVAGRGIKMLEQAGIEVVYGLLEMESRALNPGFLKRMEHKLPYVQLKLAASLDGKTALSNGESKWITGADARADVQVHRAKACAILSTAETVITDDARLNVRIDQAGIDYPQTDTITSVRQPVKVVLDGRDRIKPQDTDQLAVFAEDAEVILVKASGAESSFNSESIDVVYASYDDSEGFDLQDVLTQLAQRELNLVWVEAGAKLAASLLYAELFDELIVYQAPKIIGQSGREMLPIGPFSSMSQVTELQFNSVQRVGSDVKYVLVKG